MINFETVLKDITQEIPEFVPNGYATNPQTFSTSDIITSELVTLFQSHRVSDIGELLTPLEIAMYFASRHFSVIPLDKELQAPNTIQKYLSTSAFLTEANIERAMKGYPNIGIATGKNSMNLFILKCSTATAFQLMKTHLGGLARWITKTGAEWNIWLLCEYGIVHNASLLPGVKVLGRDTFVVAPGSYSSTGTYSTWLTQESEFPAILSQEDMKELFEGVQVTPVSDKSRNTYSTEIPFPILEGVGTFTLTEKLRLFASTQDLGKGRTGVGMHSVYAALLDRADKEKMNDFRATYRELELLSGVSLKSVQKYVERLQKLGWINLVERSLLGNRYKLCKNPKFYHSIEVRSFNVVKPRVLHPHDVWSTHGLGLSGKLIAECLVNSISNLSAKEISRATNISVDTTRKKLNKMRDLGMAQKDKLHWKINLTSIQQDPLFHMASSLGVNGFCLKKEKRINSERGNYAIVLRRRLSQFQNPVQKLRSNRS